MAHPQARVAALLDVALRPAEAAHEEIAQPLLGAGEIVLGIHRPQDVVGGDLAVEESDEALEPVLADGGVDFCVVQEDDRIVKLTLRTAVALALAGVLFTVPLRAADSHPDFSGSWLVDGVTTTGRDREGREGRRSGGGFGGGVRGFGRGDRGGRGGPGGSGREGGRARGPVNDEPGLERGQRVEMTQTDALLTVVIAPDAGGRVVRYPLDGSDGYTSTPDGTPLRTKTSWQGVALVTESQSTEKGRSYKARQVRTMDAAGHVTIETTVDTPFGKRTVTVTLTKREGQA